jgi:hypothetical protein
MKYIDVIHPLDVPPHKAKLLTRWSSNFGLFRTTWIDKVTTMAGIFATLTLEGKRIRPEKPVIKGGILLPNSR